MTNLFELNVQLREHTGKGASRRLRREAGLIPAILYGAGKPAVSLSFKQNEVRKATAHEAFFSHILTLDIANEKQQVIIKALQRHPANDMILHMDFLRISATEKLTLHVPLHFSGESIAPGVKDGGIVEHLMNDLEIKCLPADLPEFIAVDVSALALNQSLHLQDIRLPSGVELAYPPEDELHNLIVVSIHRIKDVVEPESVSAEVPLVSVPNKAADSTEVKPGKKDIPKK